MLTFQIRDHLEMMDFRKILKLREIIKENGKDHSKGKKPIICHFCNEVGHINPSCLRLTKNNYETVSNLIVNSWNEDYFEKFKVKFEINGVERVCLRNSGSSIDLCARSWINENDFLGEYVWIKIPLDDVCHCLPHSKIKIKTKGGEYYTKAAIKFDSSADEPYLLGNRTAELIESSEKGVQMINTVVTRSASEEICTNLPTANSSPIENADQIPPSEIHEEEMLEISQFDGMKEVCLANVTSSDFRSEEEKCPDLQVLWEKARSGVDGEFQIMKGKLVRVTRTKRGDEIRQLCVPLKFRLEINRLNHDLEFHQVKVRAGRTRHLRKDLKADDLT
ncbi:retrovirus-related Pol polyprotein from transposon 17.6 [Trichonephila clavata]|uniref:Retrovirus-related Pol polyprotein from transposon 17.6 n=1 Tax=Trichonephila clavata TaxID=2740835 RepID=A0A8X6HTW8_TRICU|nr:retrovirus-related Pol polyprotein from transposon 17.6 [Trichonephila clavata]